MHSYIKQKNEYYNHDDFLKRRKKVRWTIVLSILFVAFEYITIFHGTRCRPFSALTMLGSWVIAIIIVSIWTSQEKIITSTTFMERAKHVLIGAFKLLIVIVPVIYLTIKSIEIVQNRELEKHGVLTKGIITEVTKNTDSKKPTFYADFTFKVDNILKSGFSIIKEREYKIGDSVFILYSSQDINLRRIKGKIN